MRHTPEIVFYEDDKCIVTKDKWQYIVRPKPLPVSRGNQYRNATYIHDPNNLLWELCDCRHFFSRSSKQAKVISMHLKGNQMRPDRATMRPLESVMV